MRYFLQDRKTLYLFLSIVIVSVFTLSIAYAAMSAVLEIHGNSEVVASSWDIHLDNVKVKSGSVSANAPQISGTSSVGFDIELTTPGEYYEFTVDVVNEGSIDAMIDSVVKSPELTAAQAKYIKYEVTYENGESISTKQTIKKGTSTPIKVRVEYRKDLVVSDLPSGSTELNLKLTLVYVQSDGSGSVIPDNGVKLVNVVSGDGTQVGNEVCIKEECFYVISSTDESVTMLSKMNITLNDNPVQSSDAATIEFSNTSYWSLIVTNYPSYVYDERSYLWEYIENYKMYLNNLGVFPSEARLITYEELESLGCAGNSCSDSFEWVYTTAYWSGSAGSVVDLWSVRDSDYFSLYDYSKGTRLGVRPVITISKDYL